MRDVNVYQDKHKVGNTKVDWCHRQEEREGEGDRETDRQREREGGGEY